MKIYMWRMTSAAASRPPQQIVSSGHRYSKRRFSLGFRHGMGGRITAYVKLVTIHFMLKGPASRTLRALNVSGHGPTSLPGLCVTPPHSTGTKALRWLFGNGTAISISTSVSEHYVTYSC